MVWGIGVFLAIYCTRHLSCAHLNPAVSLAMVLAKRMQLRRLPVYWLADGFPPVHHLVPAVTAFGDSNSLGTAMIFADYFPNPGAPANIVSASYLTAFLAETLGTFLLVTTIFMLTEGCNVGGPPSSIAPVMIGLTVTVIITALAPLTMAGLNPARDFGPRLFAYLAGWGLIAIPGPRGGFFTIYILGPFLGGVVAALLFRWVWEPLMTGIKVACVCDEVPQKSAEL